VTTLRDLLLGHAGEDGPGLLAGDRRWTWQEYVDEAARRANALHPMLDTDRPPHVGVLLDNTPEMAFALAAAGLSGQVLVGLNTTRRGEALAADVAKADCQLVLTDRDHLPSLAGLDLGVPVIDTGSAAWRSRLSAASPVVPTATPGPEDLFMLIFTSGTSGTPKAVRVTHEKVAGPGRFLADRFGITADDVCYVSMPLFHSNAVMAGWGVAVASGAAVALGERFSASRFLDEVRAYGATYLNYVGKPLAYVLATPALPDDADNPLRIAFGNEGGERDIVGFAERFGCVVVDGFGSTENAVVVSRVPGTPSGALGMPLDDVKVLDPSTGVECPPAVFDEHGQVTNLEQATGELVNVTGAGQFAGYYDDEPATAERMRGGMYWSGDLAYRDRDGFAYFAGRTDDWLRVDGENLAAAPVERILLRHPAVSEAAVYAVPDPVSGDQLVAALVTTADLDPTGWEEFLGAQEDLSPKAWPRWVRIVDALPRTATNKVLKRELRAAVVAGSLWRRDERGTSYAEAGS
jgi:fatty-acyl-CoA synthase